LGEDVSQRIREADVSIAASNVAVIPAVRLKLVELQRTLAEKTSVIMDGRDIGTYVLPDAEVKIFLTASSDVRAKRRLLEMQEKGMEADFETVKRDIEYRDKNDSEREFAPLRKAEDAILVDTSDMTIERVIDRIIEIIEEGK
jgi:cytidylate kinase